VPGQYGFTKTKSTSTNFVTFICIVTPTVFSTAILI
jgi:hypothetical protein